MKPGLLHCGTKLALVLAGCSAWNSTVQAASAAAQASATILPMTMIRDTDIAVEMTKSPSAPTSVTVSAINRLPRTDGAVLSGFIADRDTAPLPVLQEPSFATSQYWTSATNGPGGMSMNDFAAAYGIGGGALIGRGWLSGLYRLTLTVSQAEASSIGPVSVTLNYN